MTSIDTRFAALPIERDRDQFLRELLRELSGTLENIVGVEQAAGFISIVGGKIGLLMSEEYRAHTQANTLDRDQVASALVDLKRRIDGGFEVESIDEDKIVLVNSACPFGEYVEGRESLCMMTSNVFGKIAAENLGYARVQLDETIARGDGRCRVVVHLNMETGADLDVGREYYATENP